MSILRKNPHRQIKELLPEKSFQALNEIKNKLIYETKETVVKDKNGKAA